jgi:hypothetical protein
MTHPDLTALGARLGSARTLDDALMSDLCKAMATVFPDAPAHAEVLAEPTEAVMHLMARCVPGWSIHLTGQAAESDGHWRCGLRASDIRDDDGVVGAADGPTIPLTLARALFDVARKSAG